MRTEQEAGGQVQGDGRGSTGNADGRVAMYQPRVCSTPTNPPHVPAPPFLHILPPRPEALKTQFPAWDAIDFADIASSFLPQGEQQGQDGAAKEKAGGKAAAAAAAGVANGAKA